MKIAIIDGSTVLQTWNAPTGEVATSYALPNGTQISPILLGWSSGGCSVVEVESFIVPEGKRIVGAPSYAVSDGVVIETYQVEDIPAPPRRMVRKSTVQQRLIDAELMDAAYVALTANPTYFARWFAPDRPEVYADDPDALLLLAAIGADAEIIMGAE